MPFDYVEIDDAIARSGLRMVVVSGVPSLWGEAAKGILHVKKLPWVAVRLTYDSEALTTWAGQRSGPVLIHDEDKPLSGWQDILLLVERLQPAPALLPADRRPRELVLELSHDICAQDGLGALRRLQFVHASLQGGRGFPERIAKYLGAKYGYGVDVGASCGQGVTTLLEKLANRLHSQKRNGSPYYIGDALTAADIYSATAMGMFEPLPPEQCDMDAQMRSAFASLDAATARALDPILLEHRRMIYDHHLELPLSL